MSVPPRFLFKNNIQKNFFGLSTKTQWWT